MPVFLFTLFIVGLIFLACYGAWSYGQKKKTDPNQEMDEVKVKILRTVYDGAGRKRDKTGSETAKITLLESLNISPAMMKNCLSSLFKEKMILESKDSVSLTTFGVDHYEVFHKPPTPPKKKAK